MNPILPKKKKKKKIEQIHQNYLNGDSNPITNVSETSATFPRNALLLNYCNKNLISKHIFKFNKIKIKQNIKYKSGNNVKQIKTSKFFLINYFFLYLLV